MGKNNKKLCRDVFSKSEILAEAFIRNIYSISDDEDIDEIYFIGENPAGTLAYNDEYWGMDDVYNTIIKNYDKGDVWNWYYYYTEVCTEDKYRIGLSRWCNDYQGYTGKLQDLYKERKKLVDTQRLKQVKINNTFI